ncbi:MAG: Uma2 family endonuclease [Haliscomenobacter sp.]|uniref:Uma2 family endonuclease n=1 Tax=Haliscomenobacter sp. TaxID=2717303 RepID=UPI0029A43507|nr:Uma2 family endonuclease [Haliscomenobacter sp.]MDX2069930.1 Uma2 family endonuclease [Haliscomenobacter sp.]
MAIILADSKIEKVNWETFRELELADDDLFIYELFDGEIMKRSAPSLIHQRISRKLLGKMDAYIEEKKLGEIFSAPVDLNLDEHNAFQPDLAFISNERSFLIEDDDYIKGAPDLVVEIISPGTVKKDRVIKKDLCERFAVREYWLVDPLNKGIEIYIMQEDKYVLHDLQEITGKISSTVLTGFELELGHIFGEETQEEK